MLPSDGNDRLLDEAEAMLSSGMAGPAGERIAVIDTALLSADQQLRLRIIEANIMLLVNGNQQALALLTECRRRRIGFDREALRHALETRTAEMYLRHELCSGSVLPAMAHCVEVALARGSLAFWDTDKWFVSSQGHRIHQHLVESGGGFDASAVGESEIQRRSYPQSFGQFETGGYETVRNWDYPANAGRIAEDAVALLDALKIDRAEAPAGGVSRAWWLVPLVLVALAAVAWFTWWRPGGAIEVRTAVATANREGASQAGTVLNASGYVTARRQATVSSKITGRVVDVLIEEGMESEHYPYEAASTDIGADALKPEAFATLEFIDWARCHLWF